jgi:hypothetical protein
VLLGVRWQADATQAAAGRDAALPAARAVDLGCRYWRRGGRCLIIWFVTTRDDLLAAAGPSVDPGRWLGTFDELMTRAGARFSRVEPRRRARAFVLGLLAELPRKNCWTIAEHAGDRTPDGMQHLLSRARWDADGVRDDVRSYVVEHLGDPGAESREPRVRTRSHEKSLQS